MVRLWGLLWVLPFNMLLNGGHWLNDHDRWMMQQSIDRMVFLEQQMPELE
ncbi:hypothetical protein [uncultured Paludibaculum sp.]|nr:hypothetical protein [uncultured Paludibaculum sp.]